VSDLAIPVHVICKKTYFPDSTLRLLAPADEFFSLILPGDVALPVKTVALSYNLDSYSYTFEAPVVDVRVDPQGKGTLLTLNLPNRIARIERRRSERVVCGSKDAVVLRLNLPEGESFETTAIDIGCYGACFHLPGSFGSIRVGNIFPIRLTFPRLGELSVRVSVRGAIRTPAGVRLGVEFLDLSEEGGDLIRQYVHIRQLQNRTKQRSEDATSRPHQDSIFVVGIRDRSGNRQLILCTDTLLGHIADRDVFSEIVSVDVVEYLEKK
jgi:hypothetical protein